MGTATGRARRHSVITEGRLDHFPRRYPRMGSSFQVDLPETTSLAQRPTPIRMSSELPYRTEEEARTGIVDDHGSQMPSQETTIPLSETSGYEESTPNRDATTFLGFTQRLFNSHEPLPINTIYSQEYMKNWTIEMLQWHELNAKDEDGKSSGRKSKFKRARDNNWPPFHGKKQLIVHPNPDSLTIKFFNSRPNAEQATWSTIVELSAGEAVNSLKFKQTPIYKARYHDPSIDPWRTRFLSNFPFRVGDFRGLIDQIEQVEQIQVEPDDGKKIWEAMVHCGEEMIRQMKDNYASRVLLSELWSFVERGIHLPPPETYFKDRHFLQQVSSIMNAMLDYIDTARMHRAKLIDSWARDGIDIDTLQKQLVGLSSELPVKIDEEDELKRQLNVVIKWQKRVDSLVDLNNLTDETGLSNLLELKAESVGHGFRSKGVQALDSKIEKLSQLQEQIQEWQEKCSSGIEESPKMVASMVRDAEKIGIACPEVVALVNFHNDALNWIERAMVATRSRTPLSNVKELIEIGSRMPLDLSDHLEKLRSRESQAEHWLENFLDVIKCSGKNSLEVTHMIREHLLNEDPTALHNLATEGARIPVDLDHVKLLQIEIDAKSWSSRAAKWLPPHGSNSGQADSKPGKLEDVRDHLEEGVALRDRLADVLEESEKSAWILQWEDELQALVDRADAWFEKYEDYLEADRRSAQNESDKLLNLSTLRQMTADAHDIYLQLGSVSHRFTKILESADLWFVKYQPLLETIERASSGQCVSFADMQKAAIEATESIPIELHEVRTLCDLVTRIEEWDAKTDAICNGKKTGRFKAIQFDVWDCQELLDAAPSFPIDTASRVQDLIQKLAEVQLWKQSIATDLVRTASELERVRGSLVGLHGNPDSYSPKLKSSNDTESGVTLGAGEVDSVTLQAEGLSQESHGTIGVSDLSESMCQLTEECSTSVEALVQKAETTAIRTAEFETSLVVRKAWRWSVKSLEYLEDYKILFDKRFYGAFDRFLQEGEEIANECGPTEGTDPNSLTSRMQVCTHMLVSDQQKRLSIVRKARDDFVAWCSVSRDVLVEKKATMEKLRSLARKAKMYPADLETVKDILDLSAVAEKWNAQASEFLEKDEKFSFADLKSLLEHGEKIGVQSSELKSIKSAHRAARLWKKKAQKCKVEGGKASSTDVEELLEEYRNLMVVFPDEEERLSRAVRNYCICRRPYAGFMIGCDSCDDWFHGPCIGLSESRAERFDKYRCIRCSIKSLYTSTAESTAEVVRKWTCSSALHRARNIDLQRHQRKVRKEMKSKEKLSDEKRELESKISAVDLPSAPSSSEDAQRIENAGSAVVALAMDPNTPNQDSTVAERSGEEAVWKSPDALPGAEEAMRRISEISQLMEEHEKGLLLLDEELKSIAAVQKFEDSNSERIKSWCTMVSDEVLAPADQTKADASRPLESGDVSVPMTQVISEAEKGGLDVFADVVEVIKSFKRLAWCFKAAKLLSKQPEQAEVEDLLKVAEVVGIKDDKALKGLVKIHTRATNWESKVKRALAPIPGEKKRYQMSVLEELAASGDDIPLVLPYEHRLDVVIEDKGARHCVCGGPSDGRFMLNCDSCNSWFHGNCMSTTKEKAESLDEWKCPGCSGTPIDIASVRVSNFFDSYDADSDEDGRPAENTTEVLLQLKWPPFGLKTSAMAVEKLGVVGSFMSSDHASRSFNQPAIQQLPPQHSSPMGHNYQIHVSTFAPSTAQLAHIPMVDSSVTQSLQQQAPFQSRAFAGQTTSSSISPIFPLPPTTPPNFK